jgi:hypothetical protein
LAKIAVSLPISGMEVKPTMTQGHAINRIMIPLEEWGWTLTVVCFACILARATEAELVLVEMIPVQHPYLMGTPLADLNRKEVQYLPELTATVERYGVPYELRAFRYLSFVEAIVQAAELYKAQVVFARVAHSFIPFWQRLQAWRLRKSLEHDHRQLYEAAEQLVPLLQPSPQTRTYSKASEFQPR